jgi:hypothetical protein
MTIDKGNQAVGGKDAVTVGHAATTNTDCRRSRWEEKKLRTSRPIVLKADSKGKAWVIVGTDSGFEARTEIYYATIGLTLQPVTNEDSGRK